jgi:hypothetical protein|tara:strand:- start:447 stop:1334 length:888 start_codon:yes stop_codon:yes gene_type:complete
MKLKVLPSTLQYSAKQLKYSNELFFSPVIKFLSEKIDITFDLYSEADVCFLGYFGSNAIVPHKDIYNSIISKFRKTKYIAYIFDMYEYDSYQDTIKILKMCDEVWVPSDSTRKMVKDICGLESKVVEIYAQFFETPNIKDENYILNCSPRYEFDPYWNWANKACNELDIPYKETDKRSVKRSDGTRLPCDVEISDYYKLISECTFTIVSESCTSTGGLGNLEALNLGKKCISNKKNGLINYCGDFADYFDTYEELKNLIKYNWENRNFRSVEDCKNHCYNFTPEKTAERFYKELL